MPDLSSKWTVTIAAVICLWFVVYAKKRSATYIMAIVAVSIVVAMVVYPDVAFKSAVRGLLLWWEVVFPALLPFFVGAEILMGLGVVHYMGVMLEPLMRPLFNLPGVGSFVMAMGLASGYPIGAVLTSRLRKQDLCSKTESERLVSFCNTADPLFMAGAIYSKSISARNDDGSLRWETAMRILIKAIIRQMLLDEEARKCANEVLNTEQ